MEKFLLDIGLRKMTDYKKEAPKFHPDWPRLYPEWHETHLPKGMTLENYLAIFICFFEYLKGD
jgi:hypothetical protein